MHLKWQKWLFVSQSVAQTPGTFVPSQAQANTSESFLYVCPELVSNVLYSGSPLNWHPSFNSYCYPCQLLKYPFFNCGCNTTEFCIEENQCRSYSGRGCWRWVDDILRPNCSMLITRDQALSGWVSSWASYCTSQLAVVALKQLRPRHSLHRVA